MNPKTHAERIGAGLSSGLGFDPTMIIGVLLPMFMNCFKQQANAQTPHEYLADHYDETTATFDSSLINRCRPQTRRAARQDGDRKLSRGQLDLMTVATLEHARTAPEDEVVAAMEGVR